MHLSCIGLLDGPSDFYTLPLLRRCVWRQAVQMRSAACSHACCDNSEGSSCVFGLPHLLLFGSASCLQRLHHAAASHLRVALPFSQLQKSALGFRFLHWSHFHKPLQSRTQVLQMRCVGVRQALSEKSSFRFIVSHLMHCFSSAGLRQQLT